MASSNLLIHDDCANSLKHLAKNSTYYRQVKLAYLDPPFNTGERFVDYHDALAPNEWIRFIADRFSLTWDLLSSVGSVWVHCDDSSQASVRVLIDGIVGADKFVATIVWQRRYSRENRLAFSTAQDYIHVYAPAGKEWKAYRNRLPRNDKPGMWRNPDNDPRGPWSTVSLIVQGGHGTPAQFYTVELPSGRKVRPPEGSCWRITRERFEEMSERGELWFGSEGDNVPRRKVYERNAQGLVPSTWWPYTEVGHNAEANSELRKLFPGQRPFSTPKPERLMHRILEIGTDPGDIVLDPFLGSGTTAAVAHKSMRQWIGIESNWASIENFIVPRLKMVADGSDRGGVSEALGWEGGGGFKAVSEEVTFHYEAEESLFESI